MATPAFLLNDLAPRRPATTAALDARLSVWGQASREAAVRRVEAIIEGAVLYVERVGRSAEVLQPTAVDPGQALLDRGYDSLVDLACGLLPSAVVQASRLLWVDPDRLRERLAEALVPAVESARAEVRRRQALYRRRARLWQRDQCRLDRLREDLEAMPVPRARSTAAQRVARGLLRRHRAAVEAGVVTSAVASKPGLRVPAESLECWIAQFDIQIGDAAPRVLH